MLIYWDTETPRPKDIIAKLEKILAGNSTIDIGLMKPGKDLKVVLQWAEFRKLLASLPDKKRKIQKLTSKPLKMNVSLRASTPSPEGGIMRAMACVCQTEDKTNGPLLVLWEELSEIVKRGKGTLVDVFPSNGLTLDSEKHGLSQDRIYLYPHLALGEILRRLWRDNKSSFPEQVRAVKLSDLALWIPPHLQIEIKLRSRIVGTDSSEKTTVTISQEQSREILREIEKDDIDLYEVHDRYYFSEYRVSALEQNQLAATAECRCRNGLLNYEVLLYYHALRLHKKHEGNPVVSLKKPRGPGRSADDYPETRRREHARAKRPSKRDSYPTGEDDESNSNDDDDDDDDIYHSEEEFKPYSRHDSSRRRRHSRTKRSSKQRPPFERDFANPGAAPPPYPHGYHNTGQVPFTIDPWGFPCPLQPEWYPPWYMSPGSSPHPGYAFPYAPTYTYYPSNVNAGPAPYGVHPGHGGSHGKRTSKHSRSTNR